MSARRSRWAFAMGLYLLGIFMGAIDTGIVTPARTIIQNDLGVDDQLGIWMITIYTLSYAAAIPVMGKLADRLGRKPVYLTAIALFGIGSLLCGLSQDVGSFGMLIAARSLQAIGGGGILPIATAEIGTEVPEERRGLALGLVGAVFGIANLLGASAGSLILDIAGQHNWQWIFYINVPIAAMIVIAGWVVLPNHRESRVAKLDLVGIAILVAMIMSLLYGLTNIDFFDLSASVTSLEVYPFLIAFVVLLPVFVLAERRAEDPVLNLDYFTNRPIALTLAASFLSGFILMGVVFVPQLAENALELPSGSGGYLVILLGLASGVGAPLSGRLTDAFGPKLVLAIGGGVSALAAVSVVTWLIPHPGYPSVIVSLVLIGLGLGFVIGSPLNYLMLRLTDPAQSNSALGTLSLVRSIGTTLAPVIMVGFLAHAGGLVQDRLTADLPSTIKAPELPYAASLQKKFAAWKADDRFSDALKGVEFPDLSSKTTIEVNTDGGGELPDELVTLLQDADVTTIVSDTKTIAKYMFAQQTPAVIADITKGVETGIDQLGTVHDKLGTTATTMTKNIAKMTTALAKMRTGLAKLDATVDSMSTAIDKQGTAIAGMTKGINGMTKGIDGMNTARAKQAKAIAGMTTAINGMTKGIDGMDKALAKQAKAIAGMTTGIDGLTSAIDGLTKAIDGLDAAIAAAKSTLAQQQAELEALEAKHDPALQDQIDDLLQSIAGLQHKLDGLQAQRAPLADKRAGLVEQRSTLTGQRAALTKAMAKVTAQRDALAAQRTKLTSQRSRLTAVRAEITAQRDKLIVQRTKLTAQRSELSSARAKLITARDKVLAAQVKLAASRSDLAKGRTELIKARAEINDARSQVTETTRELKVLDAAVPGAFDQALTDYLAEIDQLGPQLKQTFQSTLNEGFRDLYLLYGAACLLLLGLLPLIKLPSTAPVVDGAATPSA